MVLRNSYDLRCGLTIFPSMSEQIDEILSDLLNNLPAHFILLADVSGQIVSFVGARENLDIIALGALIAGDLAASQEIAKSTGEYQDNQMILREGSKTHFIILGAGRHLVLLVQIPNDVPLGWARLLTKDAVQQIADIAEVAPSKAELDEHQFNQEGLSDTFSKALDSIWTLE